MSAAHQIAAGLSPAKLALLKRWTGTGAQPAAATARPIPRRPAGAPVPLSLSQLRLWFLDRLLPGSSAYNMPSAVRLDGVVDLPALAAAVGGVARRHEVLRTRFVELDGVPLQEAAPPVASAGPLPLCDLGALPAAARQAEADRLAEREANRPFDLERGPLLRTGVLRLGGATHLLLITMHHIVSDGWSFILFVNELIALYGAASGGRRQALPELPIQYGDFAVWQRDWFRDEVLAAHLSYWRQRLAGLEPLELPTDRPRPAVQRFRGAAVHFTVPAALGTGLSEVGRRCGSTLFMVLLAAFDVLLARAAGQRDVSIGSPVANRGRVETERLIGFFANTVVLRTEVAAEESWSGLLARVRSGALDAFAHQDLPLEKLIDELAPERDMSRNPLFQVMFTLQKGGRMRVELPGLFFVKLDSERSTSMFDLWLSLGPTEEGWLRGQLEYNTDLFDRATVLRLLGHFHALLAAVAAAPEMRVDELPLLAGAERQQLLREWNDTAAAWRGPGGDGGGRLEVLLAEQARRSPRAEALVFAGESLAYAELHRRAGRLAAALRAAGAGPERLVAVCLERSTALLVALLAVLEAGAAYLPLDPSYPRERLAFLLADAGAELLLATAATAALLPAGAVTALLVDESGHPAAVGGPAAAAAPELAGPGGPAGVGAVAAGPAAPARAADCLAYVIYTSGSTGKPKGVMVSHRAIVNRLLWMQERYRLGAGDRVLQKTPVSFDVSVWELFWPLLTGATLVVARPEGHRDAAYLIDLIERERITTLHFVPSLLAVFLEAPGLERCRSLRRVICSGEALGHELAERCHARLGAELHNLYGPTEAAVDVTSWASRPDPRRAAVAIGRPIANLRIQLLDWTGHPAPIGTPGELTIGGVGLARGYLGRPDLTAASFRPDPFAGAAGERLYHTGDLARCLPDGTLQYLGRIDHQIKLRGFRIELGEIEAVLGEQPEVQAAVAMVREDQPGDRRLCAYLVAAPAAGEGERLAGERVEQWGEVFDTTYREAREASGAAADPAFDIAGWNSAITGLPIPPEEMREWVAATVARIPAPAGGSVLEIGCGTGLLLSRIALGVRRYLGTDLSAEAVNGLRRNLPRLLAGAPAAAPGGLPEVMVERQAAADFTGIAAASCDCVILNSVAQYFPHADYLVRVLTGAVRATAAGGTVFVGDLRCLPLLGAFHAAAELAQAADDLPAAALAQRAARRLAQEEELVVAPSLFAAFARALPAAGRVEIQLKRGRTRNELTQFRYDVLLHVGQPAPPPVEQRGRWSDPGMGLAALRRRLARGGRAALEVGGIPDARVAAAVRCQALLADRDRPATAGELRAAAAAGPAGVEPEDLWELGEELGFEVEVRWEEPAAAGLLAACFRRRSAPAEAAQPRAGAEEPVLVAPPGGWVAHANEPLCERLAARLVPRLRAHLKDRLPDYMIPQAFVVLSRLPLTASGKVDRKALPAPPPPAPDLEAGFVPPRNPAEKALAEIWAQVLGLPQVGIHNNFFSLGGNSIHSIQVVSRAHRAGLLLTARQLFQQQTIADLAAVAQPLPGAAPAAAWPAGDGLSAAQRWLLGEPPGARAWNRRLALEPGGPADPAALAGAMAEILAGSVASGPGLDVGLGWDGSAWRPGGEAGRRHPLLLHLDLSALPPGRQQAAATAAAASLAGCLDLSGGPLLALALFDRGRGRPALLELLAHGPVVGGERLEALAGALQAAVSGAGAAARAARPWGRRAVADLALDFPWAGVGGAALERLLGGGGIEDVYPGSPLQAHMWRRHHDAFVEGLFVVQRGFPVAAELDLEVLASALQRIVDRHAFLRSSLAEGARGQVVQRVHRQVEVDFAHQDWRGLAPTEQERRLAERTREERRRGFDPRQPHPFRIFVARVEDRRFHLLTSSHYMRLDGWSMNVVIGELLAACAAWPAAPGLAPPRPYTDYLDWRRRQPAPAAEAWWRERLRGHAGATPIAGPEPAAAGEELFTRQHFYLGEAATVALDELGRRLRVTLHTIVQGALALALARATGRADLLFGVMVAGRPAELPEVETMVGPFVNVLPVRVEVAAATALAPWLAALQEHQLALRQVEHCAQEDIRRWCGWPPGEPLFEVYLAFQNLPEFVPGKRPPRAGKAAGASGSPAESYLAQMEHPLRIDVFPGARLGVVLSYYPGRIATARVAWLAGALAAALAALAAVSPGAALGALLAAIDQPAAAAGGSPGGPSAKEAAS